MPWPPTRQATHPARAILSRVATVNSNPQQHSSPAIEYVDDSSKSTA